VLDLLVTLASLGLLGGAIAGAWAGWRTRPPLRFGPAFLVYLGVLSAVATTWAQSMEALPLTLVYGAAMGVLPFAAAFHLLRRIVAAWKARRSGP
jgi:hypothetical protein